VQFHYMTECASRKSEFAWPRFLAAPALSFLVILVLAVSFANPTMKAIQLQKGNDSPLCFAFLKGGKIFVRCSGKSQHITSGSDVTDFAVSSDGSWLAFARDWGNTAAGIELHSLRPPYTVKYLHPPDPRYVSLVPTCGTILGSERDFIDLVSGDAVRFDPYTEFRCSANRKVVAGFTAKRARHWGPACRILLSGLPPSRTIVALPSDDEIKPSERPWNYIQDYEVSANGNYIAYFGGASGTLCVEHGLSATACISHQDLTEFLSVSDSGEVFLTESFDGGCNYNALGSLSKKPLPGYNEGDQCTAVFFWRPDATSVKLLVPYARHPQWLSPRMASGLLKWASRFGTAKVLKSPPWAHHLLLRALN
jgi:hypothetical protein